MKKNSKHICLLLSGLFCITGCANVDEVSTTGEEVSQDPIDIFAHVEDDAVTKAYGSTDYEATTFAAADQIGVFATRTRKDGGRITELDIFHGFANVGYKSGSLPTSRWTVLVSSAVIKAPLFPGTRLNLYAYYPHAGIIEQNAKSNIIINTNDLHAITFRIHQNQTVNNLPLCNIMRAVPVLDAGYPGKTPKVTLTFEHILSYLEFHVYLDSTSDDPEECWETGDVVLLDRVVALGNKISTEGSFDLVDDDPKVTISSNVTTATGSIYKADSKGTPIVDGMTGATPSAERLSYLRRHMIILPAHIEKDGEDVDSSKGEQADMEVLVELRYVPANTSDTTVANRHFYVPAPTTFESGKKYVIKVPVKRPNSAGQERLNVQEEMMGWKTFPPTISPTSQTYDFN